MYVATPHLYPVTIEALKLTCARILQLTSIGIAVCTTIMIIVEL